MRLSFTKMAGAGNDFVVVDWRSGVKPAALPALARALCDRRRGIGADGLMHLDRGERASVRVRYYNADGSEAGLCGNGARCAALEASRLGLGGPSLTLDFGGLVVGAELTEHGVRIALGALPAEPLEMTVDGVKLHRVVTGVPHAVVEVPSVAAVSVEREGSALRRHPAFAPEGANVDFVERRMTGPVPMRTYERGVEGETLACGTGAVAVAVVAARVWGRAAPVEIATRGGDLLRVHLEERDGGVLDLVLEGEARRIFAGEIELEPLET